MADWLDAFAGDRPVGAISAARYRGRKLPYLRSLAGYEQHVAAFAFDAGMPARGWRQWMRVRRRDGTMCSAEELLGAARRRADQQEAGAAARGALLAMHRGAGAAAAVY